jgi:hypothetical protein
VGMYRAGCGREREVGGVQERARTTVRTGGRGRVQQQARVWARTQEGKSMYKRR